jgi:hypothetical protein
MADELVNRRACILNDLLLAKEKTRILGRQLQEVHQLMNLRNTSKNNERVAIKRYCELASTRDSRGYHPGEMEKASGRAPTREEVYAQLRAEALQHPKDPIKRDPKTVQKM